MKLLTTRKQCEDYLAQFTPMQILMCLEAQVVHDALQAHNYLDSMVVKDASLPKA